jgi:hypothetical protein
MTASIIAVVAGLFLMGLGADFMLDYRGTGTGFVQNFVPKWGRTGTVKATRQGLALCYFGLGILMFVVGIVSV